MMVIPVRSTLFQYNITLSSGALRRGDVPFSLDRKVLIVTDDGVPRSYADALAALCHTPYILRITAGEDSKSIGTWETLLQTMLDAGFTRKDCVVALGGGMVGDLAGFAAASYMRGIDFYNIPTTLLSQVDSSIGGKTAVNFGGIKNSVGAFYPPRAVLIDTDLLSTLAARQIANGLAESIKMALTLDKDLFTLMETGDLPSLLPTIVERSLRIKKAVVEADEKETGLRKVLNFGHTIGHGIEVCQNNSALYHGECVALGMLPMCSAEVRTRLLPVLHKAGLPTDYHGNPDAIFCAVTHDKKATADGITIVTVSEIGSFAMEDISFTSLRERLRYFS